MPLENDAAKDQSAATPCPKDGCPAISKTTFEETSQTIIRQRGGTPQRRTLEAISPLLHSRLMDTERLLQMISGPWSSSSTQASPGLSSVPDSSSSGLTAHPSDGSTTATVDATPPTSALHIGEATSTASPQPNVSDLRQEATDVSNVKHVRVCNGSPTQASTSSVADLTSGQNIRISSPSLSHGSPNTTSSSGLSCLACDRQQSLRHDDAGSCSAAPLPSEAKTVTQVDPDGTVVTTTTYHSHWEEHVDADGNRHVKVLAGSPDIAQQRSLESEISEKLMETLSQSPISDAHRPPTARDSPRPLFPVPPIPFPSFTPLPRPQTPLWRSSTPGRSTPQTVNETSTTKLNSPYRTPRGAPTAAVPPLSIPTFSHSPAADLYAAYSASIRDPSPGPRPMSACPSPDVPGLRPPHGSLYQDISTLRSMSNSPYPDSLGFGTATSGDGGHLAIPTLSPRYYGRRTANMAPSFSLPSLHPGVNHSTTSSTITHSTVSVTLSPRAGSGRRTSVISNSLQKAQMDKVTRTSLQRHNELRALHSTPPLLWDDALAYCAQLWAESCAAAGCLSCDPLCGTKETGENLWVGAVCPEGGDVVDFWYRDIDQYSDQLPMASPFTQVVWKASRWYGAGMAAASNGRIYFVARYSPGGNKGDFQSNVLPLRHSSSPFTVFPGSLSPPDPHSSITPRSCLSPVPPNSIYQSRSLSPSSFANETAKVYSPPLSALPSAVWQWTTDDVQGWLVENNLSKHQATFRANLVDGKALTQLTPKDLKTELDIKALRDRKQVWAAITRLLPQTTQHRSGADSP